MRKDEGHEEAPQPWSFGSDERLALSPKYRIQETPGFGGTNAEKLGSSRDSLLTHGQMMPS